MKIRFLAGMLLALLAFPVFADEADQDFVLVNKTGYELDKVFVSPSKLDDWGSDILGRDTLDDGESVKIKFHPKAKTCEWDLKVVYSDDGSSAVWGGIDLCSVEKITIRYNRKSDTTTASFD